MPSSLKSQAHLPLLDISKFPSDFDPEGLNRLQNHPGVDAVREGCKEWGFFSVVDHTIPVALFHDVESVMRELCDMPAEVKHRAATSNPLMSYYRTPYLETFSMSKFPGSDSNTAQQLSNKIWSEGGNRRFCETIQTYTLCMEDLARKISKIIIASLGLQVEKFYHSDFEKCKADLRMNHYFDDGKSKEEEAAALEAHTDLNCFTILYQDDKGGLQIRSNEGEWLNVKPQSHSFVVNVGDSLKAWSNGRYRSAEHRAVFKGWADRFSVPYFVVFSDDKEIWAPAELVDDEHPRRYRPLTYSQVVHDYVNSSEFKEKKPLPFFERYAGL